MRETGSLPGHTNFKLFLHLPQQNSKLNYKLKFELCKSTLAHLGKLVHFARPHQFS